MIHEELKINATDGSGAFSAYAVRPDSRLPAPAIIVIQEIFGVNQIMRDICAGFAQQGYFAVCPDLFWRQQPDVQLTDRTEEEWQKAFQLFQGFDVGKGVADLIATLDAVRVDKRCSGKAGSVGYCLGGKLAYLMATRSAADCNVSYYGVGIEDLLEESANIRKPLMMHMAEKDKFVPQAAQLRILYALNDHRHVRLHLYPGVDHAFARIGGQHYDAAAAELANGRTASFFSTHLS
jgi:carboxymethylenebutenolidase